MAGFRSFAVSSWRRGARALVVAMAVLAAQAPLAAQAAVPDRWGFAFMDNPTPPPGMTLDTSHQWGSWKTAFPGLWATVDQIGAGRYVVHFPQLAPGLPVPRGIVHVTAVNPGPVWCQALDWRPAPPDEDVYVKCYRVGGGAIDSTFTVLFSQSSGLPAPPGGDYAYVQSDPSGAIVTEYNSTGAANFVSHGPTGNYKVGLPGVGAATMVGNIQVTAVDVPPVRCKPAAWAPSAGGQTILVQCNDAAGMPVDTGWTLTYQNKRSIFGAVSPPKFFAYTWPTLPAVPPVDFNSQGGANVVGSAGTGLHIVQLTRVGVLPDHVQVTAFTDAPNFCQLNSQWAASGMTATVRDVACYTNAGAPVDERAFTTYTSAR